MPGSPEISGIKILQQKTKPFIHYKQRGLYLFKESHLQIKKQQLLKQINSHCKSYVLIHCWK